MPPLTDREMRKQVRAIAKASKHWARFLRDNAPDKPALRREFAVLFEMIGDDLTRALSGKGRKSAGTSADRSTR